MFHRRGQYGPIGLDLGTAAVKMLQVGHQSAGPAVQAAARCKLPPGIDAAAREALIRNFVAGALRSRPFRGREVVAALGSLEVQMKTLRLPHMPEDELASAVEFESRERFELASAPAQFRFLPAGEVRHGNELKQELLVFAAPDALVEARLRFLESLRLRPVAVDLAPCAMARSFLRYLRRVEDAQAVNVFVDVGRASTNIVITRGHDIAFLKTLDIGGRDMDAAVAQSLNLTPQQAADLRVRLMRQCAGRRAEDRTALSEEIAATVRDALRPLTDRITRDLQLSLRYYAVTFRGLRSDAITLAGGDANEPALLQSIQNVIDTPCIVGDPLRGFGNVQSVPERHERSLQPSWAVACGLALRGSRWIRTATPSPAKTPDAVAAGV